MNGIILMDRVVLDEYFQKFSNWFQKLTGKDNFFLAYCCCILTFVLHNVLFYVTEKKLSLDFVVSVGSLLIMGLIWTKSVEWRYRRETGGENYRNPAAIDRLYVFIRMFSLTNLVLDIALRVTTIFTLEAGASPVPIPLTLLITAIGISFVSQLYFMACTPLPPRRGKIGEWLSDAKKWLSEIGAREPIAEPA